MNNFLSTIGLLLGTLIAATPAFAAPFCVQTEALPPQCLFFDAGSCQKQAARMKGWCTGNPEALNIAPGIGRTCLVTSGMATSCEYDNPASCAREAAHEGGVCVQSPPPRPAGNTANPYQFLNAPAPGEPTD